MGASGLRAAAPTVQDSDSGNSKVSSRKLQDREVQSCALRDACFSLNAKREEASKEHTQDGEHTQVAAEEGDSPELPGCSCLSVDAPHDYFAELNLEHIEASQAMDALPLEGEGTMQSSFEWDDWDDEHNASLSDADDNASCFSLNIEFCSETAAAFLCMEGKLYIGGSQHTDAMCIRLRCALCGFDVLRFPHAKWARNMDYYHLRNYAPDHRMPGKRESDLVKLAGKLRRDAKAAAYACG
eukprot:5411154-Pleurochrysis_carterae.AAC.1